MCHLAIMYVISHSLIYSTLEENIMRDFLICIKCVIYLTVEENIERDFLICIKGGHTEFQVNQTIIAIYLV